MAASDEVRGAARRGKVFVTILCGAGDRPIARLGGRTPLQHAHCPNLDALAERALLGLLTVIDDDTPPESDSGAMALLGYDPLQYYTGRGPLEALGKGFWRAGRSSVGFRINFASQDAASGRLDRRTARDLTDPELQQLAEEVRAGVRLDDHDDVEVRMTAFGRHRGILCFTSATRALGGNVSNTDPGFRRVGDFGVPDGGPASAPKRCVPLDDSEAAATTAALVNAFVAESSAVLEASGVNARRRAAGALPANVILFRDAGDRLPALPSFVERTGLTMALYGQVPAERGICELIGGRFVPTAPRPDQSPEDFYRELARRLPSDPADVVLVHLKGADEPGHDNDPAAKVAALEELDRCYVAELARAVGPADTIVMTGDHATPCELGIHASDPVPTLLAGPGLEPDARRRFDEREAAEGGLPVRRAAELLAYIARTAGAEKAA